MFDDIRPHLVELRKRLMVIVGTLIVFFAVCFYFHEILMAWVDAPLRLVLSAYPESKLISTQTGGTFFVAIKVSFFAALLFSIPILLWQIWLFVAPGLYSNEKKTLLPFIFGGTTMFTVGVMFAYYIVVPYGFEFLIAFGYSANYTALINIEDYVGFFTKIMFGFGLAFELPVFSYFLALLGLIDDRMMKDFFKYAVIIIFIVAALLTPPDILTQLLMAGPLIVLYGFSILIVRVVNPASPEEEEEDDEDEDQEETSKA
ncbi:MAG TPA: twin-arginine translocase subunit TatC [Sulfurimonas sp.]|nr:twin-arginine translocase subunit TatC [Sulfurimonas sp.]